MPIELVLLLFSSPFSLTWLAVDWILATLILLTAFVARWAPPAYAWTGTAIPGAMFVLLWILLTIEYWKGGN